MLERRAAVRLLVDQVGLGEGSLRVAAAHLGVVDDVGAVLRADGRLAGNS